MYDASELATCTSMYTPCAIDDGWIQSAGQPTAMLRNIANIKIHFGQRFQGSNIVLRLLAGMHHLWEPTTVCHVENEGGLQKCEKTHQLIRTTQQRHAPTT